MKTQEQKMQHVMEAADECYHQWNIPADYHCCLVCNKCRLEITSPDQKFNPSPDDLKELTRLMIKLNFAAEVDIDNIGRSQVSLHAEGNLSQNPAGQSVDGLQYDAALLNALFIATGGKE